MKICFVAPKIYPLFESRSTETIGGAEVQLRYIGLKMAESHMFYVSYIGGDLPAPYIRKGPIELYRGVDTAPAGIFTKIKRALKLVSVMRHVDADVYVQRAASEGTGLVALTCKALRKKFIFMTASSIDCNGDFRRMSGWVNGWLYRYGVRHADRIITQTREQQALLKEHHGVESQVLKSVYPVKEMSRHCEKRTVLWVGRCDHLKQPELFLDIVRRLPSAECVMIAPPSNSDPHLAPRIYRMAAGTPNLRLIERVPFQEVDRYFAEAKVFVNTSSREGYPNTFLQSLAHRTPIVSLNVDPDHLLKEYQCGVCADGDMEKMVHAVQWLLTDDAGRRTLGENGYLYVRRDHDLDGIVREFSSLLCGMK